MIEQKSAEVIVVAYQEDAKRSTERLNKARLIVLDYYVASAEAEVMVGVERRTDFE